MGAPSITVGWVRRLLSHPQPARDRSPDPYATPIWGAGEGSPPSSIFHTSASASYAAPAMASASCGPCDVAQAAGCIRQYANLPQTCNVVCVQRQGDSVLD